MTDENDHIDYLHAKHELDEVMAALGKLGDAPPKSHLTEQPYCSFCGKSINEVRKLLMGPHVFICDVCVASAQKLLEEK